MKNNQRFRCKECGCNYTVEYEKISEKEKKMRFTLLLYLEGLVFHSIARLLNESHLTVMNWIRKFGVTLSVIRSSKLVKIIELDEMHNYIGNLLHIIYCLV
jgi:transposase-like protein